MDTRMAHPMVIRSVSHPGGSLMSLVWYDMEMRGWRGVYPVGANGLFQLRLHDPFDDHCCVAKRVNIGISFECIKQLHHVMQVVPDCNWSVIQTTVFNQVASYLTFITAHWALSGIHTDWLASLTKDPTVVPACPTELAAHTRPHDIAP